MSNNNLEQIILLSRYRWSMPILAMLGDHGARFAELLNRLCLPRDSLSRSLEYLIECGWVRRNTGHGHPLRPEYLLTEVGARASEICARANSVQQQLGLAPKEVTRWTMPLVVVHAEKDCRFRDIELAIPESSPRALSSSLKTMVRQNLLKRNIVDDYPPIPVYALSAPGRDLAQAILER